MPLPSTAQADRPAPQRPAPPPKAAVQLLHIGVLVQSTQISFSSSGVMWMIPSDIYFLSLHSIASKARCKSSTSCAPRGSPPQMPAGGNSRVTIVSTRCRSSSKRCASTPHLPETCNDMLPRELECIDSASTQCVCIPTKCCRVYQMIAYDDASLSCMLVKHARAAIV